MIEIIQGDCLEVMKQYPDNHFDLVLTDPPYGIGVDMTMHKQSGTQYGKALAPKANYAATNWDSTTPSKSVFDEIRRISKNQIIFGGNYFVEHLSNSSCWIVWDKVNGTNQFADCELARTSFKSAVRMHRYMWNGMLQGNMKDKEKRYHPTQKPLPLMRWILENYSKPGDLICDPFLGSGTTTRACKDLRRDCVGIEINADYVKIAESRLGQEVLF